MTGIGCLALASAAFVGAEAPPVNGLVVSADTDNTGEAAESYFGDIEFRAPRPS